MGILGDGCGGDAPDLIQCRTAQDGTGAAEEGAIPEVISPLDRVIEKGLLRGQLAFHVEVPLKGIRVVEVVRRLDQ